VIQRRRFFHHEKGNHAEVWYYLQRDAGGVHVMYEWVDPDGKGGEERIELGDFLAVTPTDRYPYHTAAKNHLFDAIGSLIPEPSSDG